MKAPSMSKDHRKLVGLQAASLQRAQDLERQIADRAAQLEKDLLGEAEQLRKAMAGEESQFRLRRLEAQYLKVMHGLAMVRRAHALARESAPAEKGAKAEVKGPLAKALVRIASGLAPLLKARVKGHWRQTPEGKMHWVAEYQDKRTKKQAPEPAAGQRGLFDAPAPAPAPVNAKPQQPGLFGDETAPSTVSEQPKPKPTPRAKEGLHVRRVEKRNTYGFENWHVMDGDKVLSTGHYSQRSAQKEVRRRKELQAKWDREQEEWEQAQQPQQDENPAKAAAESVRQRAEGIAEAQRSLEGHVTAHMDHRDKLAAKEQERKNGAETDFERRRAANEAADEAFQKLDPDVQRDIGGVVNAFLRMAELYPGIKTAAPDDAERMVQEHDRQSNPNSRHHAQRLSPWIKGAPREARQNARSFKTWIIGRVTEAGAPAGTQQQAAGPSPQADKQPSPQDQPTHEEPDWGVFDAGERRWEKGSTVYYVWRTQGGGFKSPGYQVGAYNRRTGEHDRAFQGKEWRTVGGAQRALDKFVQGFGEGWKAVEQRTGDEQNGAPEQPATAKASGARVSTNADFGSTEVSFPSKPDRGVLDKLKSAGFRWSSRNKVWYSRGADARQKAEAILGKQPEETPESDESAAEPAPMRYEAKPYQVLWGEQAPPAEPGPVYELKYKGQENHFYVGRHGDGYIVYRRLLKFGKDDGATIVAESKADDPQKVHAWLKREMGNSGEKHRELSSLPPVPHPSSYSESQRDESAKREAASSPKLPAADAYREIRRVTGAEVVFPGGTGKPHIRGEHGGQTKTVPIPDNILSAVSAQEPGAMGDLRTWFRSAMRGETTVAALAKSLRLRVRIGRNHGTTSHGR